MIYTQYHPIIYLTLSKKRLKNAYKSWIVKKNSYKDTLLLSCSTDWILYPCEQVSRQSLWWYSMSLHAQAETSGVDVLTDADRGKVRSHTCRYNTSFSVHEAAATSNTKHTLITLSTWMVILTLIIEKKYNMKISNNSIKHIIQPSLSPFPSFLECK